MTIHVPYVTVTKTKGDNALADEWNDISTAVARIEAAQTPTTCSLVSTAASTAFVNASASGSWNSKYMTFQVVEKDTPGGMQNIASGLTHDNQKITIVTAGLYFVFGLANLGAAGTSKTLSVDKNADAALPLATFQVAANNATVMYLTVSGVAYLNAGDFIALRVDSNSSSTTGSTGSGTFGKLSCARLSS